MEYKAWPFLEAKKLLKRNQKANKPVITLESGYGPSGLPHIGTFAEAARTSFVRQALNILEPELATNFITFSDDMDGLRAIPENVPNQEMLKDHIGKPLCDIPDPYEEHESYAANMNIRLKKFLDSFGFSYQFVSSADMYKNGKFNEGLSIINKKHQKVIDIFTPTISKEKRKTWSPFLPTCENCGQNTTTVVTAYDTENDRISYECSASPNELTHPCGHQGTMSVLDGNTKVGWKVDWALRWFMLGIDYEMYGKDLIDSAVISEKIVRILGGSPPVTYKYELFLDEFGKKISKKIGNGVSIDEWLAYAPTGALLNFLFYKPNQPKKMALSLIPKAVDEYLKKLSGKKEGVDLALDTIRAADNFGDKNITLSESIDYALIVNLIKALNIYELDVIMEYLVRYDAEISEEANYQFYESLVNKAITYNKKVIEQSGTKKLVINKTFDGYLETLLNELSSLKDTDDITPDTIQTLCFSIAKDNELAFKEWFKYLYQVLLSSESGPRIGSFICLYGLEASIEKIKAYLEQ